MPRTPPPPTSDSIFFQLQECSCVDGPHSSRGTTVKQKDCIECFRRATAALRLIVELSVRYNDAALQCTRCQLYGDPSLFATEGGVQYWAHGTEFCQAQRIRFAIADLEPKVALAIG